MTDYTYQSGSCSSDTGDFYSVLQKGYDRDYELGVERNRREQTPVSSGVTAHAGGRVSNARLIRGLFYTPQADELYPSWYARQTYPSDARSREALRLSLLKFLENYRASAQRYGYTLNYVPDAELLYIAAAYRAFDGDHFSDAASKKVAGLFVAISLTRTPRYMGLSDAAKQLLAERYAVSAQLMTLLYENAVAKHDTKNVRVLRATARAILRKELGTDPARVKEDQLMCLRPHALSCESYLKFMRASVGGPQLTRADISRMISPFPAR
jgi:hypothetical protein